MKQIKATNKAGHEWTGENYHQWFMYRDERGNLYESMEIPVYRISMDRAALTSDGIVPIHVID